MKLVKIKLFAFAALMFAASSAFATPYAIDTTSLKGTNGYLYLQYEGIDAVASTATLSGFGGGTLGAQGSVVNGAAVTGTLPGNVTLANTNGINDYNQAILFGDAIYFDLSFASIPGGLPAGDSTFSLGLFADEFGATALLTPTGTVFMADLANDGSISSSNASPVPEPSTVLLLCVGLAGMIAFRLRKGAASTRSMADNEALAA